MDTFDKEDDAVCVRKKVAYATARSNQEEVSGEDLVSGCQQFGFEWDISYRDCSSFGKMKDPRRI